MIIQSRLLLIITFLLVTFVTNAAQSAVEFSAETIESQPGQGQRNGRLYIGQDRVRSDIDINGETIVQIIDLGKQEAIVINAAQKSFIRRRASEHEIQTQASAKDASPCAGMQNLVCKDAGSETINGRKTLKWEITNPSAGKAGIMRFWLDAEHRFPVRQEMPDGSIMEMRLLERETVNGRDTEKWEMTAHRGDGQSYVSLQWYDPKIRMNIREQLPGGFARNLINIKLQPQPVGLFSIPAGFTEITMQQPAR